MSLPRKSVLVGLAAHLLSIVIAVGTLIRASSPFTWDLYALWVATPYLVLGAALLIPWGDADRRSSTGCITALVALAVSHYFYRAISGSGDSMIGILFLYLPMFLLPACAVLWALLYWLGPPVWAWLSAETGKLDD
jgi:hypothetical protein